MPAVANANDALRPAGAQRNGNTQRVSAGFQMWLNGPFQEPDLRAAAATVSFGTNVDAADPAEDLAAGQSETAVDATPGGRVLDAWNDATGFSFIDSTLRKASLTGVGLSLDHGATFTDLVGLKNTDAQQQWSGDPAVVAIDESHFVVASLYVPSVPACQLPTDVSQFTVAAEVLTVRADGRVRFGKPLVVSQAGNLCPLFFGTPPAPDLATLDKDTIAYDPATRTLSVAYTRFFLGVAGQSGLGQIEIARASVPANPAKLKASAFHTIVVWPEESACAPGVRSSEVTQCGTEQEGAAVGVAPNGDSYVAWERNLFTNTFGSGDPYVYEHAAVVRAGATSPAKGGPSSPVVVTRGQLDQGPQGGVRSLDATTIPGYNRGVGNDFPSVAFQAGSNSLIVEWGDASHHALGDVFLRRLNTNLATSPIVQVNDDASGALHFLPAVSIRGDGTVCSSWYDRRAYGPTSTFTDYFGDCGTPAGADFAVTTGPTDWNAVGSLITPNFGDYTDNASVGGATYYTWSDGRIGVPQPFVDHSS
jgi:hypothetical protein